MCICTCRLSLIRWVTSHIGIRNHSSHEWPIHMCDMTHSYAWLDASISWRIHMCTFICVYIPIAYISLSSVVINTSWNKHIGRKPPAPLPKPSLPPLQISFFLPFFSKVALKRLTTPRIRPLAFAIQYFFFKYLWHDSCICESWLINSCDMCTTCVTRDIS